MTTALIFVVILAAIAITLFVVTLRSRGKKAEIQPLDLPSFYTLLDREDESFLRKKLSRREFSRVKRKKIRVTWKYVGRISNNSAAVLRWAGMARQKDPDPKVAEAALQTVDLAAHIRTQCLIAFAKLSMEFLFPSMQFTPAMLAPKYESLRANLDRLSSLHPRDLAPLPAAI
jgi:hypothetical protein